MNRTALVVILLFVLAVAGWLVLPHLVSPGTIEFQGHTIHLSRYYLDYDDYKNDPENIAPGDRQLVRELVSSSPVPRHFSDRKTLIQGVFTLRFPGYGTSSMGEQPLPDGAAVAGLSVEVPYAKVDRVFLFRKSPAGYDLIDDFAAPNEPGIISLRVEGRDVVCSAYGGAEIARRPIRLQGS